MFWVYAIKSQYTDRIYVGQTKNLEERLTLHNSGMVQSTKKDRPWTVIAYEIFDTRENARWQEYQLKKSRGKRSKWLRENSTGLRAL
jgi:putative endonuclease